MSDKCVLKSLTNSIEGLTHIGDSISSIKPTVVDVITTGKNEKMSIEKLAFYEKTRLIFNFTFENLIVGRANELARAAAIQVACNPGDSTYNPLFIYGSTGLGKTHLTQ